MGQIGEKNKCSKTGVDNVLQQKKDPKILSLLAIVNN